MFSRTILALGLIASLGGCLTTGQTRTIYVEPTDAAITIVGYGNCASPCTLKLDGPRHVKVANAGYLSKEITITPGIGRIKISLELAAPTEDVEQAILPDLN